MKALTYKMASLLDVEKSADLFLDGKGLERLAALDLFKAEFTLCETLPNERIYMLASHEDLLVAYAGARFYDQQQDENMYDTSQLLPTGWYLRGLKVRPEWRRSGVGREMTKKRLAWLSKKTKIIFVFLNDETKETIPMYKEFGFEVVSAGWDFLNYQHKRDGQRGILLRLNM